MEGDAAKKRHKASYEDLLKVPDHKVAEIIEGELVVSPRPAALHALAASMVGGDLLGSFGRKTGGGGGAPGGWWILFEPELHLGADVLVPDLAGWRRERMPRVPDVAFFEMVPDWVCEVVSPRSSKDDRVRKRRIYGQKRVKHMWLVDPRAQTLEVFRLEGESWVLLDSHAGADRVRAEPFDAVELSLANWWIEPPAEAVET